MQIVQYSLPYSALLECLLLVHLLVLEVGKKCFVRDCLFEDKLGFWGNFCLVFLVTWIFF